MHIINKDLIFIDPPQTPSPALHAVMKTSRVAEDYSLLKIELDCLEDFIVTVKKSWIIIYKSKSHTHTQTHGFA